MDKYLLAIISGMFALLAVVLTFFLKRYSERKRVREEFLSIKNSILHTTVVQSYGFKLLDLKRFFISHPNFLKKQENKNFFQKWLMKVEKLPFEQVPIVNVTLDKRREIMGMLNDLCKTKP